MKGQLEEAQRRRRKQMEKDMRTWVPVWFDHKPDPVVPGRLVHQYKVRGVAVFALIGCYCCIGSECRTRNAGCLCGSVRSECDKKACVNTDSVS